MCVPLRYLFCSEENTQDNRLYAGFGSEVSSVWERKSYTGTPRMEICRTIILQEPITVAEPFKAQGRGRSIAGIAGSNPAESMDFRRLGPLCVVWLDLHRVPTGSMCAFVCDQETPTKRRSRPDLVCCSPKDNFIRDYCNSS